LASVHLIETYLLRNPKNSTFDRDEVNPRLCGYRVHPFGWSGGIQEDDVKFIAVIEKQSIAVIEQ
jgi:hypothetical protein